MNVFVSPGTLNYLYQLAVVSKARRQTKYMMLRYRAAYR